MLSDKEQKNSKRGTCNTDLMRRIIILLAFPTLPVFTFFDPNDPACLEILLDPRTSIPELFAIIRQWVPQVQHKIDLIGNEVSYYRPEYSSDTTLEATKKS